MAVWRLFKNYFGWHYRLALVAWWRIYRNLLWFLFNFFSVALLFRTLAAPWRRLNEAYPKGFNPGVIVETLVVNGLMRLFGLAVRSVFLLAAALVLTVAALGGWFILALWLVAPGLILLWLILGFYLAFLS